MTTPDTTTVNTTSASLYQRLRGHLATLKLHDAAEALPSVLDRAQKDGLSMTAALEQLLAIEVDATEARRLAGRLRFACLPTPASLDYFDFDAAPGLDRALITELGSAGSWKPRRTSCSSDPRGSERRTCRWVWRGLPRMPAIAPTSPPPPIWQRAVIGPRSKGGGRRRCGSTPGRRCW